MAIRQLKPYLKSIADAIREKTTDAVNLLDFKTARNRDGYTGGVFNFTDIGFTYTGTYYFVFDISLESNKTYILSCDFDTGGVSTPTWCLIYADGTRSSAYVNKSITPTSDVVAIWIYPQEGNTSTITATFNNMMLEVGDRSHEYVPYGYKEPINAQDFPSKIAEVYEKGKQTEYDRFWDEYQQYGKRTFYSQGFAGDGWTKDNLKPKYPIVTNSAPNRSNGMFMYASKLTEIMIPLYFYDSTANSTFANCIQLVKIGDDTGGGIWQTRNRTDNGNFSSCSKLEEIRYIDYNEKGEYVPTEIGKSISFVNCKVLSMASVKNIISHLVNYTGTSEEGKYTLTLYSEVKTQLQALEELAPSGSTWVDEISNRGWNLA